MSKNKFNYMCAVCGVYYKELGDHVCTERNGREFEGGAYRDGDHDKLDYARALDPRVLERYVAYLGANRLQSNGQLRDWDNWKQGIPKDVYMSSAWRHMHTIWKSHIDGEYPEDELCAVMFNIMGLLYEVMREDNDES